MTSTLRNSVFCCFISCSLLITATVGQLTFHNDPLSNSFTLKAPGVQQSFTRYFGGKRGNIVQGTAAPLQAAPATPATLQQQLQYQHQQYQQPQAHQYQQQHQPQYHQQQLQPQYHQYQLRHQQQQLQQQQQQQQPTSFFQQNFPQYSSSSQYQNPSQGQSNYPFEAAYEQSNTAAQQQQSAQSYVPQYAQQAAAYAPPQAASYRGQEYSIPLSAATAAALAASSAASSAQAPGQPLSSLPGYSEQLQQSYENYQQEQQMQQMLAQQQQQQERLLMDLYKQPQGQGRPVTENGRSQAFYTADQYINFLNRQHQDVFRHQQQNVPDRGYSFSPMSAYTEGVPTNSTAQQSQYSPASNVSSVNYTNGKLTYNY